jgi:hypothetical protein
MIRRDAAHGMSTNHYKRNNQRELDVHGQCKCRRHDVLLNKRSIGWENTKGRETAPIKPYRRSLEYIRTADRLFRTRVTRESDRAPRNRRAPPAIAPQKSRKTQPVKSRQKVIV